MMMPICFRFCDDALQDIDHIGIAGRAGHRDVKPFGIVDCASSALALSRSKL